MKGISLQFINHEKTTFKYHLIYSIIEGIIFGILSLNEFVFLKSMKGSTFELGLLFQVSTAVFILLIFFNVFIKRVLNKRLLLQKTALITRLPLLLLLVFPRNLDSFISNPVYHYIFLLLFLLFYLEAPITYPLVNLALKNNYRHKKFGELYGFSTSINKIVTLFATFAYGILLDIDNYAFTYILPATAILGIISLFLFSRVEFNEPTEVQIDHGFIASVRKSIHNMISTMKKNHPFRHFEIGFMLYGFAFMISVTVITIFYEEILHLNYTSVAFYKNAFNIIAILLIPLFGRLIGKIDPRKFASFSFVSLMFAVVCILFSEYYQLNFTIFDIKIYYLLLVYVVWYGLFIGSMTILWRIGSAYFCDKGETALYQSIHLSATGVRAMFAPIFGVLIYELFGFTITFVITIFFLMIAIIVLVWSLFKYHLEVIHD